MKSQLLKIAELNYSQLHYIILVISYFMRKTIFIVVLNMLLNSALNHVRTRYNRMISVVDIRKAG